MNAKGVAIINYELRIMNYELRRNLRQHFCAEDLVGSIALAVFDGTLIAAREEEHPLLPHHLCQVVIEIARLFLIVEDKEERRAPLWHRSEHHRCAASLQSRDLYHITRGLQRSGQSLHTRVLSIYIL